MLQATHKVHIIFLTYNPFSDMLSHIKVEFELDNNGNISPSVRVDSFPIHEMYSNPNDYLR